MFLQLQLIVNFDVKRVLQLNEEISFTFLHFNILFLTSVPVVYFLVSASIPGRLLSFSKMMLELVVATPTSMTGTFFRSSFHCRRPLQSTPQVLSSDNLYFIVYKNISNSLLHATVFAANPDRSATRYYGLLEGKL